MQLPQSPQEKLRSLIQRFLGIFTEVRAELGELDKMLAYTIPERLESELDKTERFMDLLEKSQEAWWEFPADEVRTATLECEGVLRGLRATQAGFLKKAAAPEMNARLRTLRNNGDVSQQTFTALHQEVMEFRNSAAASHDLAAMREAYLALNQKVQEIEASAVEERVKKIQAPTTSVVVRRKHKRSDFDIALRTKMKGHNEPPPKHGHRKGSKKK